MVSPGIATFSELFYTLSLSSLFGSCTVPRISYYSTSLPIMKIMNIVMHVSKIPIIRNNTATHASLM